MLYEEEGISVVLDETCPQFFLEMVDDESCDVVILDLNFDKENGLDYIEKIHEKCPKIKVIVFSMHHPVWFLLRQISCKLKVQN